MDLYNFLPKYPEIENEDLNSYEGQNFNQVNRLNQRIIEGLYGCHL